MITERAVRMTTAVVAAAMVILGIGVERAHAQDGEFIGEWLWEVTTDDGDALVEPGETAAVTLSVDLDPSVGDPGPTPGLVVSAFGGAIFDVLGGLNADKGQILGWEYPTEELLYAFGDVATTDGISIFGVSVAQGVGDAPEDPGDPLDVLTFFWRTENFTNQYVVEFSTNTSDEFFVAWEGELPGDTEYGFSLDDALEASIAFDVVPVPSTGSVIALFSACLLYRPHRCAPAAGGIIAVSTARSGPKALACMGG